MRKLVVIAVLMCLMVGCMTTAQKDLVSAQNGLVTSYVISAQELVGASDMAVEEKADATDMAVEILKNAVALEEMVR